MKAAAALTVIGIIIAALGIYLGYATVTRYTVHCGSAFGGDSGDAARRDLARLQESTTRGLLGALEHGTVETSPFNATKVADACDSARADRRTLALIVLVPGLAVAAGGLVLVVAGAVREDRERRAGSPG